MKSVTDWSRRCAQAFERNVVETIAKKGRPVGRCSGRGAVTHHLRTHYEQVMAAMDRGPPADCCDPGIRAGRLSCSGRRPNPLLFQRDVLVGHRDRGIVLAGYSGLKGGVLSHPTVLAITERLRRIPAQIVIRWHLQHSVAVCPRSKNADRIRSNADVGEFELTQRDMVALDTLGGDQLDPKIAL